MTTTTQKARRPFPYCRLHAIAEQFEPRFRRPFVHSVQQARSRISEDDVRRSLETGAPVASLIEVFDHVTVAKQADPAQVGQVYAQEMNAVVLDMVDYVERELGLPAGQVIGQLQVTSPFMLRAAQDLTADLVRGVTAESKAAIRRVIFDSIQDGLPPRESAHLIRNVVGLTERQARQVANFSSGLRDAGRTADSVDRLSRRLSNRLLRQRASNIARTETLRASNRGNQLLWEQMADQGIVDRASFRQQWLTTPDERLCPRCSPMNGKTVMLGQLFRETERGALPSSREPVAGVTTLSPPLHTNCRCVVIAAV